MSIAISPRRIAGLDGLRALAAAYVLVYHVAGAFVPLNPVVKDVAGEGWVGVDVFFTISGFILFLPFARAARGGRPVSLKRYASSRVRRILPAFWLNILVVALLTNTVLLFSFSGWKEIFGNATFTAPYLHVAAINPVTWTLFAEAVFYLLLPLAALAFINRRWIWGFPLVLLLGIGRNWLLVHRLLGGNKTLPPSAHAALGGNLDTFQGMFIEFSIGMMTAVVWVALERRGVRLRQWLALLTAAVGIAVIVAVLVLLFRLGEEYTTGASVLGFLPVYFARPLLSLGAGVLILGLCYVVNPLTFLFDLRPVRYLGVLSYGIYLWHYPMSRLIFHAYPHSHSPNRDFLFALVATSATAVALAALSFHFVEKRFMGVAALKLRAFSTRRGTPTVEPVSIASEPRLPVVTSDEVAYLPDR